jgi:hypothetical protein
LVFGIDDTPTKRYGPKVEGAGLHHNPTPGPAGAKLLYGHLWVTVSWIVQHPLGGVDRGLKAYHFRGLERGQRGLRGKAD